MCHSMMVGRSVFTARSAKRCSVCEKPYVPNRSKIVREVAYDYEDGRVYPRWLCARCSALWDLATDDTGGCPYDERGYAQHLAETWGWKTLRAKLKAALQRIASGAHTR